MKSDYSKLFNYVVIPLGLITALIFIYNISVYYTNNGPDGDAHNEYVYYLSVYLPDTLKLPSIVDTYEYFSPPIPYLFPAMSIVLCRNILTSEDYKTDCLEFYDNFGQAFLFLIFVIYIIILFQISKKLFNEYQKFFVPLVILTMSLSVNYQMFSTFRGETYILFFSTLIFMLLLKISESEKRNLISYLSISLLIGLLLLSRQWSVFFLPTIFFFWIINKNSRENKKNMFYALFLSGLIGIVISIPFYTSLIEKENSVIAWNGESYEINLSKYPTSFYTEFGFSEGFFTNPTETNTNYKRYKNGEGLFPVYISTIWGDPNGYFSYIHLRNGERYQSFEKYLGVVYIISLFLIGLSVGGIFKFFQKSEKEKSNQEILFFKLIIFNFFSTFLFYIMWMYLYLPSINANYILQITNLLPFFSAYYIYKIKNRKFYNYTIIALVVVYIFFIPTFIYGSSYLLN